MKKVNGGNLKAKWTKGLNLTKVAFISGHRDVTIEEFNEHYVPLIEHAISEGHLFVVGDYQGVDYMAQQYLANEKLNPVTVVVYHMFTAPRNYITKFLTKGGYVSDEDRDSAMTKESDYDIAWVRPGKEKSGTAINIRRRAKLELERNSYIESALGLSKLIDVAKMVGIYGHTNF